MRVQADAAIADGRLTLKQFAAQAAGASLRGSGEIDLADNYAFSAQTILQDFDPARFGDFPAARINGDIAAQGHLRPDWGASIRYQLRSSSLRGQALGGKGRLTLSAHSARDIDARSGRLAATAGAARQLRTGGRCARFPARRAAAGGRARGCRPAACGPQASSAALPLDRSWMRPSRVPSSATAELPRATLDRRRTYRRRPTTPACTWTASSSVPPVAPPPWMRSPSPWKARCRAIPSR